MSKSINQAILSWEDALNSLRRNPRFRRGGQPLSDRDADTWSEALLLQSLLWTDLLPSRFSHQHQVPWLNFAKKLDVLEIVTTFKSIDQWFLSQIEDPVSPDWECFKHTLSLSPNIVDRLVWPILPILKQGRECSLEGFSVAHQSLVFLSRVNLRDYIDDGALEKFVKTDDSLAEPNHEIAHRINLILREWLSGFRVTGIPSHGPGSTADAGSVTFDKYAHLGSDTLLDYVLRRAGFEADTFFPLGRHPWTRCSKLQLVPKTALTKRTICMEPATLQYFQQMVRIDLYDHIAKVPSLRRHIQLQDQTRNRMLAQRGSEDGSLATIDLSSASDTVSWSLAREAFYHTPLLPWLYATRSRQIQLEDGRVLNAKKFAPMGSALCFPIECLIFASVCELAVREYGEHCGCTTYNVFGDDIVIASELAPIVMSYLRLLGFIVNNDKSFVNQNVRNYRESCGGEYLDGVDVTPLRVSRKFEGCELDVHRPDRYVATINFANDAFAHGYINVRRFLIRKLLRLPEYLRPAFGERESDLHTYAVTNFQLKHRVNWKLQLEEVAHGASSGSQPKFNSDHEAVRLFHWLLLAEMNPDRLDPLISKVGKEPRAKLKRAWTPVYRLTTV